MTLVERSRTHARGKLAALINASRTTTAQDRFLVSVIGEIILVDSLLLLWFNKAID